MSQLLYAFECNAGGSPLDSEMLRETLKGACSLRGSADAEAADWEWRASPDMVADYAKRFPMPAVIPVEDLAFRSLRIGVDKAAKNTVYLVDKSGMIAGQIVNLAAPSRP